MVHWSGNALLLLNWIVFNLLWGRGPSRPRIQLISGLVSDWKAAQDLRTHCTCSSITVRRSSLRLWNSRSPSCTCCDNASPLKDQCNRESSQALGYSRRRQSRETMNGTQHAEDTLRSRERMDVAMFQDSSQASSAVAQEIVELVRKTVKAGKKCVLGLATGSTPMQIYRELVREHRAGLSFSHVVTFNLDEYYPMSPDALQSYYRFMHEHLFDHIDIDPANVHIPDGTLPLNDVPGHCAEYEAAIKAEGGIDLQLLGLGRTGHIGFNEKGSARTSVTRLITLDSVTSVDAASDFFGEEHVPRRAITMGLATILQGSKRILLVAFGENKAGIVRRAVEGAVSEECAASFLQDHPDVTVFLDSAAAAALTRIKSPWVLGRVDWQPALVRQAVIWLARTLDKPILKLTDPDYNEHSLQDLLAEQGPAYDINLQVFHGLQSTITGWPGGKPSAASAAASAKSSTDGGHPQPSKAARYLGSRSRNAEWEPPGGPRNPVFPKTVLIMSPHPDDDVISCGGTFIRLVDQGHRVHVAYQTSGNIAVWDEDALRFADFATQFNAALGLEHSQSATVAAKIDTFLKHKSPGEVDSEEVQKIKTLIRYCEARSAGRTCGARTEDLHFLDLPFYETGAVVKKPLSRKDVQIVVDLFEKLQPDQIFAAGDLSDPHGTHRTCLQAIMLAIEEVKQREWFRDCEIWLYRGAWQEFEPHEIQMAVPLSPLELSRKINAIFKHQSQKDRALFPGADSREFWQRARDRNIATAQLYDKLGLTEYEAIEAFVRYSPDQASPFFSGKGLADM